MSHIPLRLRAIGPTLCLVAALLTIDASAAAATKIKLFVPIIVIALVGVVLTELVMWLERRMSRWRQLERERF
jgi:ABC-type nitrate/sulfonate/bicarbonate transport system permease component